MWIGIFYRRAKWGACACVAEITLRDVQFVGEDAALSAALSRRMPAAAPLPTNLAPPSAELTDFWSLLLKHIRTRRAKHAYEKDPTTAQIEAMAMRMMEQSIYAVQYRFKDIANVTKKYEEDPLFRMAAAFEQMDQWQRELHVLFSFTMHPERLPSKWPNKFRTYRMMMYYTHALRKMVDITYTVEFVIKMNDNLKKSPGTVLG